MWSIIFFWNFWPAAPSQKPSQYLFITGNFIPKASRNAHSLLSKCTMTSYDKVLLGLSAPGPVEWVWGMGLWSPPLFVYSSKCFELCQLRAVGDGFGGRHWGTFPFSLPPFTSMGDSLGGVEVEKFFHYIKRRKEETGSQWPLARPQECANPGNWPVASLLRGCWLGKTGSLAAAKNADNGLLDSSAFESLAFVLLLPKVTFIGHLCMHAKR